MEITLPTLILSYLVIYLTGFGAGLLTCCRWKDTFMSSRDAPPRPDPVTVQGAQIEASAPHITEIKLSQ